MKPTQLACRISRFAVPPIQKQKIICKPENHRIDIKEIDFFYCIRNNSFSTLLTNGPERLARDQRYNAPRQYIGY